MEQTNLTSQIMACQMGIVAPKALERSMLSLRMRDLNFSEISFQAAHNYPINSMDINHSGELLLSGGKGSSLFIHYLLGAKRDTSYSCHTLHKIRFQNDKMRNGVETVQWYPFDSGMMFTSGMDKILRVWDVNTKTAVESFLFFGKIFQHHVCPVPSVNSSLIAVATSAANVSLVDLKSGKHTHQLEGHEHGVLCCQWSPIEEHILATGGLDSAILIWDVRSSKSCLMSLDKDKTRPFKTRKEKGVTHKPYVNAVKFSPDGKLLISTGSDDKLICWNMLSMQNMKIPFEQKVDNRRKNITCLQVASVGRLNVVIVPSNNVMKIFNAGTGKLMNVLKGHFDRINTCAYHRNNMEVYSAGIDRQILFWTVPSNTHASSFIEPHEHLDGWNSDPD